jgi:hypothetical protein
MWHVGPDGLGALIVGNGVVDGIRGTIAPAGNEKTPPGTQPNGVSSQYQLSSPSMARRFQRLDPPDQQIWRVKASDCRYSFGEDFGHCAMIPECPAFSS